MKKLIPILLLVFVFAFSLIGCSPVNKDSSNSDATGAEEQKYPGGAKADPEDEEIKVNISPAEK